MLGTSNEEETLYLLLESLNFGRENKELVTRKINKTIANYDQCYTRKKKGVIGKTHMRCFIKVSQRKPLWEGRTLAET